MPSRGGSWRSSSMSLSRRLLPGQSVVLYDGTRVLGGATIREAKAD